LDQLVLYFLFKNQPAAFQTGWFVESLATQILVIYVIRTKKIPIIQSMPSLALLISTLVTVLIGWLLPYLVIGKYFGLVPLPFSTLSILQVLFYFIYVALKLLKDGFIVSLLFKKN